MRAEDWQARAERAEAQIDVLEAAMEATEDRVAELEAERKTMREAMDALRERQKMPKISTEADRVLAIIELAARRTRDKHNQFASSTRDDQWWKTFADEIAALLIEWRRET